jgi:hypothetical protein
MRKLLRGLGIVVGAALALACTLPSCDSTNDVDRRRADVMRDEPLFRTLDRPPYVEVGWATAGPHDWRRPNVSGTLASWQPSSDPAAAALDGSTRAARALAALRENGWTVLWATCTAPDSAAGLTWRAVGYRIRDGVSYWFELRGEARSSGGLLGLTLVAPHHFDPDDLFPDRPTGLAAGETCVEASRFGEDGHYLELEQHHPAKRPNPDPSVR